VLARAALPPSLLDARPGPPERFRAVAVGGTSVRVTWELPAGNPRLDGYIINVRETNETGWPLPNAPAPMALRAGPKDTAVVVKGLAAGRFYAFIAQVSAAAQLTDCSSVQIRSLAAQACDRGVGLRACIQRRARPGASALRVIPQRSKPPDVEPTIIYFLILPCPKHDVYHPHQAVSKRYGDPAYAFRGTPAGGQGPPRAPRNLGAQAVGNGTVVLHWCAGRPARPPKTPRRPAITSQPAGGHRAPASSITCAACFGGTLAIQPPPGILPAAPPTNLPQNGRNPDPFACAPSLLLPSTQEHA
jgi:hypothetical protein